MRECAPEALAQLGASEDRALRDFKAVWIRKDPPFDVSYLTLCWLLALEEKHVAFFNRPSSLLRLHEKLIPFEAVAAGALKPAELVPTHIGDSATARRFLEKGDYDPAVRKPFLGFGGSDVKKFSWKNGDSLPKAGEMELTQPFLPEIATAGDRRVFFIGGKLAGDFVRRPKAGEIVSNIARGGSAHLVKMTARQKATADRLGRFLKKQGVVFAGADMIGNHVSEVNITSPTGIRTYVQAGGIDLAPRLLDYAERSAL
jgi:glutathione synthase